MTLECDHGGSVVRLSVPVVECDTKRAERTGKTNARTDGLASFGAILFAFVASQHHNLHMLLLAVGLGAGMGFMTAFPLVRHVMLVASLAMVVLMFFRMCDRRRPAAIRIVNLVSVLIALGLTAWTVSEFGL